MIELERVCPAAQPLSDRYDADVIFYNGMLERPYDHKFIQQCRSRKRRKNVLLVLVTPGGSAHAAYRVARCLQRNYEKFTIFVPGWCKSAGTLLAIGAHSIVMGECGELGPIDVQRGKEDELLESSSGLTEDAAFERLESAAQKMFNDYLLNIKQVSRGQVTFRTAAEVAVSLVTGQLQAVYSQIDPLKLGENTRAMNIARDYGLRLTMHSKNLKGPKALEQVVQTYASHEFV